MLNITNASAVLIRDEMTGDFVADVLRCLSIVPNLPYSEINITVPNKDHEGCKRIYDHADAIWPKRGSMDPQRWSQSLLKFV